MKQIIFKKYEDNKCEMKIQEDSITQEEVRTKSFSFHIVI